MILAWSLCARSVNVAWLRWSPTAHVHDLIMQEIRSGRYAPFGVTHGQGPLEWCSLAEMDYTTLKSILVVYSRLNPLLGDMVVIYPLDSTLLCALRWLRLAGVLPQTLLLSTFSVRFSIAITGWLFYLYTNTQVGIDSFTKLRIYQWWFWQMLSHYWSHIPQ